MNFSYRWNLSDLDKVEKNGYKVFSCFAGGGGSSQGYKMAGYDVIGCNEIDKRQMEIYLHNLKPKYHYLEDIRTFRMREDLPKELFELDILDGSPPCTVFSTSNNSKDEKSKEKKFREGQVKQRLDDLFYEFIELANKLKPKVVVAENVTGLTNSNNKEYMMKIYEHFRGIGYRISHYTFDFSELGLPQRRNRVVFFAVRKDIYVETTDLYGEMPYLNINKNYKKVPYKDIEEKNATIGTVKVYPKALHWWGKTNPGEYFSSATERELGKRSYMDYYKTDRNKVLPTITAHTEGGNCYNQDIPRTLTKLELQLATSFPLDYDFLEENPKYVCGMSVPPLAMYRISKEILKQWLYKN